MDLAYVCEWEKWSKSTHCPSVPLACAWSCRNLIAFTMDLRSDDQGVSPLPPASPPGRTVSCPVPQVPGTLPCGDSQASPHSSPALLCNLGESLSLLGVQRVDSVLPKPGAGRHEIAPCVGSSGAGAVVDGGLLETRAPVFQTACVTVWFLKGTWWLCPSSLHCSSNRHS